MPRTVAFRFPQDKQIVAAARQRRGVGLDTVARSGYKPRTMNTSSQIIGTAISRRRFLQSSLLAAAAAGLQPWRGASAAGREIPVALQL